MSWFIKKKADGSKSDTEEETKGPPQVHSQPLLQAPPQASEEDASGTGQTQYKGVHGLYNPLAWENMPKSLRDQFPHWKDNTLSTQPGGEASAGEEAERKLHIPSSFKQPDNTIPYVVMEHDTVNSIALKFDTTPTQLAHLNRKQLGMMTLIPGEVVYVPDSQRREGEDEASSLFDDNVSPKSAPPELKAFVYPVSQKVGGDAVSGNAPRLEGGEAVRTQEGDIREVRSASPNLCSSSEVETASIACTYVTEDQGCVRGTLIFTPSAIHFKPDPADRLVQEKGADSYDIEMLIQELVFVGLSGDPHLAVNQQRARKPGNTAQATVTQEERALQPQALSDSTKSVASVERDKMTSSVDRSCSSSGSGQELKGRLSLPGGPPQRTDSTSSPVIPSPNGKKPMQESSPLKKESAPTPEKGEHERKLTASSEAPITAQIASSQTSGTVQSSSSQDIVHSHSDQDKVSVATVSSEVKLTVVTGAKDEGQASSAIERVGGGAETGGVQKDECDFAADSKSSISNGPPGTPVKDGEGAPVIASDASSPTDTLVGTSATSSPLKPTSEPTSAVTMVSTPKKDSCPTLEIANVGDELSNVSTPVVFEVGGSPLKHSDSSLSASLGGGGGQDSLTTLVPSDSISAPDPDKTVVASEDPLAGFGGTEQGLPQEEHTSDACHVTEEGGTGMDANTTIVGKTESPPGGGPEVHVESSEQVESKEVVGTDHALGEPAQGWDECHEKCASPADDVRFLNVRISNKSHQKYTYMPVTIGYSLPRHLQFRNSFVKTGFCFAVPDSSIDGIVASVMRHHPSARTPAKQARESAVIINLDEPEDLVINNEHFENEWEIYSWGTESTREPSPEPLPVLRDKADLLDEKLVRQLTHELLPKAISCDWVLLYSTFKHGTSLQTLYRNIKEYDEDSPLLLIARDEYHKRFGVMLSSTMRISTHFLGTGESYLFSVEEFGKLQIYRWSGINDYIFQGNSDSIVFGSDEGHFGLWLHESLLRGTSSPCATFNNPCLSTTPEFECTGVEVWGFVRSH